MKTFYTYEDWTQEATPRCFYVGKGDADRVAKSQRNRQHAQIVETLGLDRRIVLTTEVEAEALDLERMLIVKHHTHLNDSQYNGIGCNRTLGGQGNSGRIVSDETRRKISESKKGKRPNKVWSQSERDAMSKRMSALHKGKKISDQHRAVLIARMADPVIKAEMVEKVSRALNKKYWDDPTFKQKILGTRARGEKRSNFTEIDVMTMRAEWDKLDRSVRGAGTNFCMRWAQTKNVTKEAVFAIVTRKTWKHVQDTYVHVNQDDKETVA